ncbi:MAG: uroporphyrinogen decarboxylase/cobalamine-independent methonine synthase family protein, partial [Anaerolineae bacterium]
LPGFISNVPFEVPADEVVALASAQFERRHYFGDDFPHWWLNFGPGIVAGLLGTRVHSVENTVWFEPVEQKELQDLDFHYQADNPWWQRILALTEAGARAWGKAVQVSHTDLGGNLDILASFRTTQQLLTDLYDAPEQVDRLVRQISQVWIRYYDELDALIYPACRGRVPWAPVWSKGTSYMLQSDFSYMISPAMFDRFVMPDMHAMCDHLDYAFYHLDGKGEIPHLPSLLSLKRLRGIQWVPGDGAPLHHHWLELYQRIIGGGKLCQIFCSADSAMKIVRAIGGRGFMFAIGDAMNAEEAQAFLREMRLQDISQN